MKIFNKSKLDFLANFCIVIMLISLCLFSTISLNDASAVAGSNYKVYYKGLSNSNEVSLMFNVYWGTEFLDQILEVLKEYEVKTTFFLGGSWADKNSDYVEKLLSNGHELGNHGYFHKEQSKLSYEENLMEIKATNVLIKNLANYEVVLFAPPSGDFSDNTLKAAQYLNMKTIMWSKDTIDWRDKDENLIFERATKNIESGDLILMHPTACTLSALDKILNFYKNNDIMVVPVSKNIQNII